MTKFNPYSELVKIAQSKTRILSDRFSHGFFALRTIKDMPEGQLVFVAENAKKGNTYNVFPLELPASVIAANTHCYFPDDPKRSAEARLFVVTQHSMDDKNIRRIPWNDGITRLEVVSLNTKLHYCDFRESLTKHLLSHTKSVAASGARLRIIARAGQQARQQLAS